LICLLSIDELSQIEQSNTTWRDINLYYFDFAEGIALFFLSVVEALQRFDFM